MEAPDLVPSISLPIRRKERSLSSLVINSTRVPPQSALTRRRTKAAGRKIVKGLGVQPPIIKEENLEDCLSISHLPETLRSISQNVRQVTLIIFYMVPLSFYLGFRNFVQ